MFHPVSSFTALFDAATVINNAATVSPRDLAMAQELDEHHYDLSYYARALMQRRNGNDSIIPAMGTIELTNRLNMAMAAVMDIHEEWKG